MRLQQVQKCKKNIFERTKKMGKLNLLRRNLQRHTKKKTILPPELFAKKSDHFFVWFFSADLIAKQKNNTKKKVGFVCFFLTLLKDLFSKFVFHELLGHPLIDLIHYAEQWHGTNDAVSAFHF